VSAYLACLEVGPVSGSLCLRERGESLSQVVVREGETFDSLLRRFSKRVQMDGILSEARRRSHFEKPSVQRKRKAAAKRRKSARTTSSVGTTNGRR
jgi:small subunit ribosomal protein S21